MSKKKNNEEKEKKSLLREALGTIVYLAVVCVIVYLILTYVGQRTVVSGCSMDNTLKDGQNLIMDKLSYHFHDPERFDIVIFPGPNTMTGEGTEPYIKRVIGLPGEMVQIVDGKVLINGEILKEDIYGKDDFISSAGSLSEEYILGEDEYFCMGDNREASYDCRYPEVGMVHKDQFIGRAWIRIWPFSKFGAIEAQAGE